MTDHPTYSNPPVVETILGVQFKTLEKFGNADLGMFAGSLGDDWVTFTDAPPLEQTFERFGQRQNWGDAAMRLQLRRIGDSRLQIRNSDRDRMIQVQNGRLHFNWIRERGRQYPRYEAIREEFIDIYGRLADYIENRKVGKLLPNQWEVTYVNRIPCGTVWESPQDWDFFRLQSVPEGYDLARLESFGGEWHFEIPDQRGRLHIQWQHASLENNEQVILNYTARGPANDTIDDVLAGLDLGRGVIVDSFRELSSDAANQYWGLEHA